MPYFKICLTASPSICQFDNLQICLRDNCPMPNLPGFLLSCQTVKNKYCVSKTSSTRDRFGTKVTSAEKKMIPITTHSSEAVNTRPATATYTKKKNCRQLNQLAIKANLSPKQVRPNCRRICSCFLWTRLLKCKVGTFCLSPFFYFYRFLRGDVEVKLRLMTMLQNTLNNDLLTSSSTFPIPLMRND